MNYTGYIEAMCKLLTVPPTDSRFLGIVPSMIAYAEGRLYREGDFLTTVTRDYSTQATPGLRTLNLPTNPHFITVQQVNVVTPPATTNPDLGTRNPLTLTTKEYLDNVWNSASGASVPTHVGTITDQTFIVGPWPDQAYTIEYIGTIRPAPLSSTNPTTFLTTYLPDIFIAASMIFGTGYQRDFGAQSDDPQAAQSWEQQYMKLFASSNFEEMRKRWAGGAWSAMGQDQTGTQNRGAPPGL